MEDDMSVLFNCCPGVNVGPLRVYDDEDRVECTIASARSARSASSL